LKLASVVIPAEAIRPVVNGEDALDPPVTRQFALPAGLVQ
jgi:hypothetical protein